MCVSCAASPAKSYFPFPGLPNLNLKNNLRPGVTLSPKFWRNRPQEHFVTLSPFRTQKLITRRHSFPVFRSLRARGGKTRSVQLGPIRRYLGGAVSISMGMYWRSNIPPLRRGCPDAAMHPSLRSAQFGSLSDGASLPKLRMAIISILYQILEWLNCNRFLIASP